jgi:uncharacterized protein (TIGR03083 family)
MAPPTTLRLERFAQSAPSFPHFGEDEPVIDFLDVLEQKGAAFIDLTNRADLDAPVPCCPDWRLRDLALHLGHVWEWARRCVEEAAYVEESEAPLPDDELEPWLREQLGLLVAVLRATDPASPTWSFGPKPRLAAFWPRRQAHEVTVHLWDAQSAIGMPEPIEPGLAADGIDEVFTVFLPRQVRLERMQAVRDGVRIALTDGRSYELGDQMVAEVTGEPSQVLLALWHRVPVESLSISGDRDAAGIAFDRALTP